MGPHFLFPKTIRQRRLLFWLALAGVLCLFPLFFVGGPGWSDGPLYQAVWNLGHPIFLGQHKSQAALDVMKKEKNGGQT